jgi:hypothetical protein
VNLGAPDDNTVLVLVDDVYIVVRVRLLGRRLASVALALSRYSGFPICCAVVIMAYMASVPTSLPKGSPPVRRMD